MQLNYKLLLYSLFSILFIYIVVFKVVNVSLKKYTLHSSILHVPLLVGLSVSEAEDTLFKKDLKYSIIDSAAYNPKFTRGAVLSHDPKFGTEVKPGRRIYLTINPLTIQYLPVPNVKNKSIRQSRRLLENNSFQVGNIYYVNHFAKDVVQDVMCNEKKVTHNDSLPKFSIIDLYLGNGHEDYVLMPNIINMPLGQLKIFLHNNSLNMGLCSLTNLVSDSVLARVYSQNPENNTKVPLGSFVTVLAKDTLLETSK